MTGRISSNLKKEYIFSNWLNLLYKLGKLVNLSKSCKSCLFANKWQKIWHKLFLVSKSLVKL